MVNDPLTSAVALSRRSPYNSPVRGETMAKPLVMRQDSMRQDSMRQENDAHALIASAVRTLEAEAGGISALKAAIDNGLGRSFTAAIDLIRGVSGRVIVTGMGKSGHVGRKVAATLASTGTPAFFVHPSEASHGDLGMITPDDVIMALSWSGETAELKDLTNYSRRFKIGLIAVTAYPDSALAQAADVVIALPHAREACPHNLAPTTSTLMQQALGDALAIALLESRGFTAVRFAELHPGGRLGAMLKFVRDIMRSGAAMPVVPLGTRMAEALVEMTAKSLGCVLITNSDGQLQGIITDGDLRRHMQPDLPQTEVERIMTRAPMTVAPDMLASEALEILNSSKKTQLIVVQDDKPVGVVHVHDLLRAGVA
jgi:arabinose-5-phosphate isomerase